MSVCYQRDRHKSKSSVQSSMNFSESTDYDLGINRLNVEHDAAAHEEGFPTSHRLIFDLHISALILFQLSYLA